MAEIPPEWSVFSDMVHNGHQTKHSTFYFRFILLPIQYISTYVEKWVEELSRGGTRIQCRYYHKKLILPNYWKLRSICVLYSYFYFNLTHFNIENFFFLLSADPHLIMFKIVLQTKIFVRQCKINVQPVRHVYFFKRKEIFSLE